MITSFFAPKDRSTDKEASGDPENSKNLKRGQTGEEDTSNDADSNKKLKMISSEPKAVSPEVTELLSHLHDSESSDKTWSKVLARHFSSSSFERLAKFVASERKSQTIYPPACDTFSALNLTPLEDVKVVVVGQDPYHGPNQAHGLSFSVRKGVPVPMSLKNIYKELSDDEKVDFPSVLPTHGYLERWAKQGVLMLNAVLTVRKGTPNSHGKKGWEAFTDEVIRELDRECRSAGKGVVFLLWGKPASAKTQTILQRGSNHKIICTSHPSPLGARKTSAPFLGSRCFSRVNEALKELGHDPIDWNVDGEL